MDDMAKFLAILIAGFTFCFAANNALANTSFKHAPCWVTNTKCVKHNYAAVGISNTKYSTNPQLATAQAQTNAISNLALTASAKVQTLRFNTNSLQSNKVKRDWQSKDIEHTRIQSTVNIRKFKFVDKWIDANGTLYIIVVVDRFNDITKSKLATSNSDDYGYGVLEFNHQVIRSNMEYAKQLTKNIRSEVQILMH